MKLLYSQSIARLGVLVFCFSLTLSAATFDDETSDEDWNNPLNWSSGALPGTSTGETAYIIDGQAVLLTTPAASVPNVFSVTVGNANAGGSLYLSQDMPTLATIQVANSDNGAIGEWTQTSGDVNANSLMVGETGGGAGAVYLAGGSMSLSGNIDVLDSGRISIQGDGVALTANNMTLSGTSSLELILGAGGFDSIDLSGALTVDSSNALFDVDCGFYQGGSTTIELIKYQSISGAFASNNITLQGLEGSYSGSIVTDSDSINVVITASPTENTLYMNTTQDDLWSTNGNWSTASVPEAVSKVILNNGRTAIVDQDLSVAVDTVMVGNNAFTNTLLQLEADFATNNMMIGFNSAGIGKVKQLGGDVVVNRIFQIASTTTSGINSGSYTISDGTLAFPYAELTVGTVGTASFRVEGSQATDIRGADLKLGPDGSLEFILDQAGVTGIRLDGSFEFETGSTITVDGTDYKGFDGYFPLIRGGDLVGSFDPAMVNLIGFTGRNAEVIVDDGLWIRLIEAPLLSTFGDDLTGLFPASSVAAATADNTVSVFSDYSPSGSLWSQSFSEAHVMSMKLSNSNTGVGGSDLSWDLRIGRGGQIYSFRNDSMGELVPPQSYSTSPWIDSVWQGVAVDSYLNNTVDSYFIHQAGMYVSDSDFTEEPFFSPMVAANSDISDRYVSTVNWGSHTNASIYTDAATENDFQSSLLFYNRYKDLGDGVIEVTLGIYNYGEDTMQHLNMPFGGIRRSTLNYAFLSNPDGTWESNVDGGFFDNADTGGWVAYSDTETTGASASLGVVYGYGDTPFEAGTENSAAYIRSNYYTNGSEPKVDDTAWRNGHLFTNIRKFDLSQGQGAWCRYYFVFGDTVTGVKSKIDARGLVASAELTAFDFTETSSPLLGYSVSGSEGAYELVETSTAPQFYLYAHPVAESFPIYEIVEKGMAPYLSASPYTTGIVKTYDGTIAGIRLLGFALKTADINSDGTSYNYSSLESVLSSYSDYYRSAGEALSVRVTVDITMPDVVAHWSLDEVTGNVAADSSGNGHDAVVTGAQWSVGISGGSLYFDGDADTAVIPAAAFASVSSQVSIALWTYGGATQAAQDSVFNAVDVNDNRVLNIHLPWSDSQVYWDAGYSVSFDRISAVTSADTYQGQWNHWVFTKNADEGAMKMYLNGALVHSESGKTNLISSITEACFGSSDDVSTGSYEGILDEVMLYDVALTDLQVAELYSGYTLPKDYAEWLLNYPELSDVSFDGDPEGDGIATGVEYVLAGSPTGVDALLIPELVVTEDSFVFTFTRSADSVPFTQQVFQYGSTLSGWTDLNITEPRASEVSLGAIDAGEQQVTVTISKAAAVGGQLFGRLKVAQFEE